MRAGKFDGIPTPPMFEVADPGEDLAPAPPPFGRGEKTEFRVWCPLGQHLVRVIDDGEHLRYATHWPSRGGGGSGDVPRVLPVHCGARPALDREEAARQPGCRLPARQAKGATMSYCRAHGVGTGDCGCALETSRLHIAQAMFDGDTSTAFCLCGWEGTRWLTTITTNGWASASREGREHVRTANQQLAGGDQS